MGGGNILLQKNTILVNYETELNSLGNHRWYYLYDQNIPESCITVSGIKKYYITLIDVYIAPKGLTEIINRQTGSMETKFGEYSNKTHCVNKHQLGIDKKEEIYGNIYEIVLENNITNEIDINVLLNIIQVQSQQLIKLKKNNQIIFKKLIQSVDILNELACKYNLIHIKKGKKCSVNGNNYEKKIHNVIKNVNFNNNKFTIQKESDLAGSSCGNDLECILDNKIIGIEVKIYSTSDWMQCSLKYINGVWSGSKKGKIPEVSRNIFNNLLKNIVLFNGKVPPFINKKYTHKQWISIKKKTDDWDDNYIGIPNDTIKNLYKAKGCYYIQISEYGLYHLGDDI